MVAQRRGNRRAPGRKIFFRSEPSSKIGCAYFTNHPNKEDTMTFWQRNLILTASIAAGCFTMLSPTFAAPEGSQPHKINVGLQLYSLRAQLAKDVPGTLAL